MERERDEMWFAVLHRLLPFRNGSWCTPRRKEGRRMNGGETAPGSCFTSKRKGGIEGAVFIFFVPWCRHFAPFPRRRNLKCRCQNAFLSLFLSKPKISSGSKPQQGKKRTFLLCIKKDLV